MRKVASVKIASLALAMLIAGVPVGAALPVGAAHPAGGHGAVVNAASADTVVNAVSADAVVNAASTDAVVNAVLADTVVNAVLADTDIYAASTDAAIYAAVSDVEIADLLAASDAEIADLLAAIASGYENTSGDWAAMDMAAYGLPGKVAGADIVKNARAAFTAGVKNDVARAVIVLTALGVDASHVYAGEDAGAGGGSGAGAGAGGGSSAGAGGGSSAGAGSGSSAGAGAASYLDFIGKLGGSAPAQIMEAVFMLIALDSGDYDDGALAAGRAACINYLLDRALTPASGQVAWAVSGGSPDVDATAMAMAALSSYYAGSGADARVTAAVGGALEYLSAQQGAAGHLGNSNSTAMAIVALAALGVAPDTDAAFVKNGKSLIDGLLSFKTSGFGFGYNNAADESPLSTEQAFRALVAYMGLSESGSGAYNIYRFTRRNGDGSELTGESNPDSGVSGGGAAVNVSVRVEDLCDGLTLMPKTTVKVKGSQLDALKAALAANGKNPATDLIADEAFGYVIGILGYGGADMDNGWMYAVNGAIPYDSLTDLQVAEGDSLVMFYMNWNDSVYISRFESETASVTAGAPLEVKLTGVDTWDAMGADADAGYGPIAGARITVFNIAGAPVGNGAVTGADGKAVLTFPSAGTYTLSAKRQGAINATDLVPPICTVKVTSGPGTTGPGTGGGSTGGGFTVYFTLQGLKENSNSAQTWISSMAVTNLAAGATVSDVIVKALSEKGYSQSGAGGGYVKSVTTPDGFTLGELYNNLPNSGWLFKVNSQLPVAGMDSYKVKSGDRVLLYFTLDFTKDPDASKVAGGADPSASKDADGADAAPDGTSTAGEAAAGIAGEPGVPAKPGVAFVYASAKPAGDGLATASVGGAELKAAFKDAIDSMKKSSGKAAAAEVIVLVDHPSDTKAVLFKFDASALKSIGGRQNTLLTFKCGIAGATFDVAALGGGVNGSTVGGNNGGDFSGGDVGDGDDSSGINGSTVGGNGGDIDGLVPLAKGGMASAISPPLQKGGWRQQDLRRQGGSTVGNGDIDGANSDWAGIYIASYEYIFNASRGTALKADIRRLIKKGVVIAGERESALSGTLKVFIPLKLPPLADLDSYTIYGYNYFGVLAPVSGVRYDPQRGGYELTTDRYGAFFAMPADLREYAREWPNPYPDVGEGDWYYGAVEFLSRLGALPAPEGDVFGPDANCDKSHFLSILYRHENEPYAEYVNLFDDVKPDQWYTDAVVWAYGANIAKGRGDGLFGPLDEITREQAVTLLWNYARYKGANPQCSGDGADQVGGAGQAGEADQVGGAGQAGEADQVGGADQVGEADQVGGAGQAGEADQVRGAGQADVIDQVGGAGQVGVIDQVGGAGQVGGAEQPISGAEQPTSGALSGFADGGRVSDWALEAMQWALSEGLVRGRGGDGLAPGEFITNAEAVTIIARLFGYDRH